MPSTPPKRPPGAGSPAHLSVELDHLNAADLAAGPTALRRRFRQVAPWIRAACEAAAEGISGQLRVSTCLLIDDYFGRIGPPAVVIPAVVEAARDAGLEVDYLARETGCVHADGTPVAQLVADRLAGRPQDSRPTPSEIGWLCNGERSPSGAGEPWQPPVEAAPYRHSIFVDIQLWDDRAGQRTWSCSFLAAVWQLMRLGLVTDRGKPLVTPEVSSDRLPERWADMPPLIQLNPDAHPFSAYRTLSILASRYLAVEHAVRTILTYQPVDQDDLDEVSRQGRVDGVKLPANLGDRIDYVFFAGRSSSVSRSPERNSTIP
jgi:hypothetical protein